MLQKIVKSVEFCGEYYSGFGRGQGGEVFDSLASGAAPDHS